MIYLLDTSALLAHYRDEEGALKVQAFFEDEDASIAIASLTLTEFSRRMNALGASREDIATALENYCRIFSSVVAIDESIARKAFLLGLEAESRLPMADALIAAAAHSVKAVLVHRDPHFGALPSESIKQQML
jgi:predicted nucleic acid-binding protein